MTKIGQQLRFREHSRSRAALPKVFTVQVLTRPNLQYFFCAPTVKLLLETLPHVDVLFLAKIQNVLAMIHVELTNIAAQYCCVNSKYYIFF